MPLIPLIQKSTPLANAPAPVLDREKRPTVNNKGLQAAVGELGGVKAPLLPGDQLAAPYKALGAVGEAIKEAGSVAGAVAIRRAQAETYVQVTKADAQLDVARA